MKPSNDTEQDAIQTIRAELLKKLLPELEKAKKLVSDLEAAIASVQGVSEDALERPAIIEEKTGRDVAVEFLSTVGEPRPFEEVVQAILRSGVMLGKDKPRTQAEKSIRFAVSAGIFTNANGLVGLSEWDRRA
jgi:hypothetical protein